MAAENETAHVLELEGEIDLHETPRVKELLNARLEKQPLRLIVDLTKVSYIDSSGLAAFIDALQKTQAYGGTLALAGIHDNVRTIFQISRLDKVFAIFPDVATAANA